MATVITLHGTNATGPEEGDRWWQRGSAFERDLRSFVEAEDGILTYAPLVWSGLNSESARREAADKLVQRAKELEAKGEKYCVIGHSHGGSVISHALLIATNRKLSLPGLSRWITVGTPFIEPQKARLLFSRLGVLGRSAYLTFFALALMFVIPAVFFNWKGSLGLSLESHPLSIAAGTLLPVLALYAAMLYFNYRKLHHYRSANLKRARETFGERWRAFWHRNDEAVCGLRSIGGLNLAIFERQFAVPIISMLTVLAIPLGLLAFVLLNHQLVLGTGESGIAGAIGSNLPPEYTPRRIATDSFGWALTAVVLGALLYLVSLLITYLSTKLASLFSGTISAVLNNAANAQIRARAYGYDAAGEIGAGSKHHPSWLGLAYPSLPEALSDEVAAVSDRAAAVSLAKFRSALSDLTFAKPGDSALSLDAYLCWDELIHTAYFSVPRFRKLLAWEVASSPGFRPSQALMSDPESSLLRGWSAARARPVDGIDHGVATPDLQVVPAPV
jgi:hypothetical protein